jgi:hypothetical protein
LTAVLKDSAIFLLACVRSISTARHIIERALTTAVVEGGMGRDVNNMQGLRLSL